VGERHGDHGEAVAVFEGAALGFGERWPLFGAHRVDEDDSGYVAGILESEATDDQSAEGVADEEVRGSDVGLAEEGAEFADDVGWGAFGGGGAAPAEAGSVVGDGSGEGADGFLQACPVLAAGCYAGLEDYGRARCFPVVRGTFGGRLLRR
jgi:hypothetical protein